MINNGLFHTSGLAEYRKKISNEKLLLQNAERRALAIFHRAAQKIPAYKDFLKKFSVNSTKIKTFNDFESIPYTTKENYIYQYPLHSRCWDGNICATHAIAASSGSSGQSIFWPRELEQEKEGALLHRLILEDVFSVSKRSTLVINGFALGNWIAGMFTQSSLYLAQLSGSSFTLANPGYNQEEIFKIIRAFSSFYDQTILICHPPIIRMLIESGLREGIPWSDLNIRFLGAGEGFSENWRDALLKIVGQPNQVDNMINIYGSADAGLMGFESPLTIHVRRMTSTNHLLNQLLFQSERNPYLYQFDPGMKYLESIDGELAITMQAQSPLIRYNIHDRGGVIHNQQCDHQIVDFFEPEKKIEKRYRELISKWPLPFVYLFGREAYMLSLLGVNIYPENIKAAVEHSDLQPYFTGRFSSSIEEGADHNNTLQIRLELKSGRRASKTLMEKTQRVFIHTLKQLNSEYDQVEQKFGSIMHPHLKFHRYHHPTFFAEGKIKKMS